MNMEWNQNAEQNHVCGMGAWNGMGMWKRTGMGGEQESLPMSCNIL